MPGSRSVQHGVFALSLLLALGFAPRASAFALFSGFVGENIQETLELAPRWSSISGLDDGIQVGVHPDFATALSTQEGEDLLIEQRVLDAFAAWENPVLDFDITLGASGTVESVDLGFEFDLFAVSNSHSIFSDNGFFGFTSARFSSTSELRTLTNGQVVEGYSITGVDIYLNIDLLFAIVPIGQAARLDAITRLLIHEIGHGIGLGHPNGDDPFGVQTNYDTDFDPLNAMTIDPNDPFSALLESDNRDAEAIMSNTPCGINPMQLCDAAVFTTLQLDDIGGRDALYPVPEPSTGLMVSLGLIALACKRSSWS